MREHLIGGGARIVEALEALNRLSGGTMVLFAVDGDDRLLGSLTDGDIRRALLAGHQLTDTVENVCKRECLRIERDGLDISLISRARAKGIALLPVVEQGRIISLLDLRKQRGLLPVDALLMAGGRGERLRPMTLHTPKPLLPVKGKPIIDHNLELLRAYGIGRIYVAVNYLKEQIVEYLRQTAPDVTCVEEPKRMGTIGAASLIDDFSSGHILVMNADLLTDVNLEAMYLRHVETEAMATMAVVPYSVAIPFAIVDHEGQRVTGLKEKPTYHYYANAGIYLFRKEVIETVDPGEYTDATDLLESVIDSGGTVSLYPIEGTWSDIGSPEDYRKAGGAEPQG